MEEKIVENKKDDLFHSLIYYISRIYLSIYLVCIRSTTPLWFTDRVIREVSVKATHRDSTSAAQHKTQGKRITGRWKIDCETIYL